MNEQDRVWREKVRNAKTTNELMKIALEVPQLPKDSTTAARPTSAPLKSGIKTEKTGLKQNLD